MIAIPYWLLIMLIVLAAPLTLLLIAWLIFLVVNLFYGKKIDKEELNKASQCPDEIERKD